MGVIPVYIRILLCTWAELKRELYYRDSDVT
jgi:hypothetical protein